MLLVLTIESRALSSITVDHVLLEAASCGFLHLPSFDVVFNRNKHHIAYLS